MHTDTLVVKGSAAIHTTGSGTVTTWSSITAIDEHAIMLNEILNVDKNKSYTINYVASYRIA